MDNNKFIIAEFDDGLQLIPSTWFNGDTLTSIWPSHFKTKYRINKAIVTREMPRDKLDWEELPIKKIFGIANTYEEGLQKLVLAEDTSNVDDVGVSSSELREREKKRRHMRARKYVSSSSEEEVSSYHGKENIAEKILPALPQKRKFISNDKELSGTSIHTTKNILCESILFNAVNTNDITNNNKIVTNNDICFQTNPASHTEDENPYTLEFKQVMLRKLNTLLYKVDTIANKLDTLQEKEQYFTKPHATQKSNIQFPISTFTEITLFEEQLQDLKFKEDVLNILQLLGGHSAHIMIRNILKKVMTDNFATHFSWSGKRNKRCFKDLQLSKVMIQAVRLLYKDITDNEFADYASKWLAQATVRIVRQKKEENSDE